ncbi:MAG TPA: TadE/TadG family type IV pilus assembly protein [Candidatus Binatia bacterium]|nr:TadE/TadG family type IV pilus assembly protein [Candidatus Binatia bacterium]
MFFNLGVKLAAARKRWSGLQRIRLSLNSRGQSVVEFTLVFILLLIIAWIPADFGLAFYTGQLAQNASREGARIAAADRTLTSGTTSCTMPCTAAGDVLQETAERISSALLPGATVTLTLDPASGTNCNRMVTVSVSGNYNYFFYRLLGWLGHTVPSAVNIVRSTSMRWEHQQGCVP